MALPEGGTIPREPDEGEDGEAYFGARAASGFLVILIACALVILDAFRTDFEVNPVVIIAMFVTAAGLFGVELPALRR